MTGTPTIRRNTGRTLTQTTDSTRGQTVVKDPGSALTQTAGSARGQAVVKDPGSALTHFIGMAAASVSAVPLLIRASAKANAANVGALGVFMLSMIMLYTASTVYHTFDISEKVNRILQKIDHMMIYVLIAGTYTPVCAEIGGDTGRHLLTGVWIFAALGILMNLFWITCPKWLSSVIYIAMGWLCVTALRAILAALSPAAFAWLLAGGLIYTAGGVIYALRLPLTRRSHPNFGNHEIFHVFVMAGSFCHFIMMYCYVA